MTSPVHHDGATVGAEGSAPLRADRPHTRDKALAINLDPVSYGTFAEIGAAQEVARWFFRAGGAAGTIAKTMSAYDMAVSDAVYGPAQRYVSRQRLRAMLDFEYELLVRRLGDERGSGSAFFVFADTVATRSHSRQRAGDGWMGIRFQHRAQVPPSEVLLHVAMRDREPTREQEALGILGVNLIYGALRLHGDPRNLVASLVDDLTPERIEVDLIRFAGPAFDAVDNRLMSLELVEQGLTDATMFSAEGEVVQPSEVLHKRVLLVERGSFRPVVPPALDMLDRVQAELRGEGITGGERGEAVELMEMTLHSVRSGERLAHADFLALADMLRALGKTVMISTYGHHYHLSAYLRQFTPGPIAFVMGIPALREMLDERYYADLGGGLLEALGRFFQSGVRLYAYPSRDPGSGAVITADTLSVPPSVKQLYAHLRERGLVEPLHALDPERLHLRPRDVRDHIERGNPAWEAMVPPAVVPLIKECGCPGLRPRGATSEEHRRTDGPEAETGCHEE